MSHILHFLTATLLPIGLAILALGLLILLHEFGHFMVARWCKMRVDVFSIGFGPALWRKKYGQTTYQIAALPLGGYVQIAGMSTEDRTDETKHDPQSYENRPAWQRFLAVFAGPAMNYIIAAVIFIVLNLVLGVVVQKPLVALDVGKDTPAMKSGLQPGDRVVAINGTPVDDILDFKTALKKSQKKGNKAVTISIIRVSPLLRSTFCVESAKDCRYDKKEISLLPSYSSEIGGWLVGIDFSDPPSNKREVPQRERVHQSIGKEIVNGLNFPFFFIKKNFQALSVMSWKDTAGEVGGPVKIVSQLKGSITKSFEQAFFLIAIISTMLALMNLLPLPAIDGGRLVFLAWEVITRRPVNKKVEQWIHTIGILLLLTLFVVITGKDIKALFSRGPH